jgi:ABC-type uncharacterized transport system substrate-binding protein
LGYSEGQNVLIEYRSAGGNNNRVQALADELVALPVDVIVTSGAPATIAAKKATSVIPIVVGAIADPIALGVVQNLSRPEGMLARDAELAQAHAEVANACQIALNSDPPFASKNDPL